MSISLKRMRKHYMRFIGDPIKLGRQKKPRRIIKDFLSEFELSRIIVAAGDDLRKKSIVNILAYAGIRNQELCNLKVKDLDLGASEIKVLGGKNSRDYIVARAL